MARILIIDDIKEEREAISEFLRKEGFETVETKGSKEALGILGKDGFDLVVINIQMPKENGLEVLKEIGDRDPGLCIIIITASALIDRVLIALRLGAYDFVERPIRNEELLNAVKRCLEKRILEKKLNEANGLLNAVLGAMGEGVIVIDKEMKIVAANRGFIQRINSRREDAIGRKCYEVSHHYEVCCKERGEECPVLETFRTGEPVRAVHTHYDALGNPFKAEVNSYPIKDEKGKVIQAVETVMDVTDRVRHEEEMKKRVKELEEFYDMAIGRELRMAELKKEIEGLKEELSRYKK